MSETSVTVNLGYTMNIGNYQSFRIDLGCTDAVKPDETLETAMDRVYAFIESKVVQKLQEADIISKDE